MKLASNIKAAIKRRLKALVPAMPATPDRPRLSKPRICILADFPHWAYDICASQIKRELADEFDVVVRHVVNKPRLPPKTYDLLHVCFWGENSYKRFGFEPERIVKEVSSHRWQEKPFGPCTAEEFARCYLSDCDTVICTSRRLSETVGKVFPRTFHVPNGVDTSRFTAPARRGSGELVFGWAGDVDDPVKGFRELIEPACGERFKLVAAKGDLDHQQMAAFYKEIDILVVASRHEGTPLPLLEAMASGCFPVCVDVGVVPELIKHQENGYIVPERNIAAFRDAFEWCDKNREDVRAAGAANAELMVRERSWKICAEGFGRVYRETLARANRPLFRNDDVSWDTNLDNFRRFCATFHKYGQIQIHGVVLHGCTSVVRVHNGAEVEYDGFDSIARLDNAKIRELSMSKAIEDRADLIEFLNDGPDELALHGLFHTDYSVMSEEEQDRDIGEGLALMRRLFPSKRIRFFIAPFNRTSRHTYEVAARHKLKVSAAYGVHLEAELGNLVVRPGQWYRYHHHRFYSESRFTYYPLSIEKLDMALRRNFEPDVKTCE